METIEVGDIVGSRRWPYFASHPETWGKPRKGVVLQKDDPRAWAGTIAFPSETPDADSVKAHVAYCDEAGLLNNCVPVLWNFDGEQKVYWERLNADHGLRHYAEDYLDWMHARIKAFQALPQSFAIAA